MQNRYVQELQEKKVITLNVPDEYEYMDEELQEILHGYVDDLLHWQNI